MIFEALWVLLLSTAMIWEVWNDRKGDFNKRPDVAIRLVIMWVTAAIVALESDHSFGEALLFSFGIHFLLFDYLVTYVLIRNGVINPAANWFRYMSKSSRTDNVKAWRTASPWARLLVRLAFFIPTVLTYFVW